MHKTLKKERVNFVSDMKKHGISSDIDKVKVMKVYLENSPQNVNEKIINLNSNNSPLYNQ